MVTDAGAEEEKKEGEGGEGGDGPAKKKRKKKNKNKNKGAGGDDTGNVEIAPREQDNSVFRMLGNRSPGEWK